jgi:hypothetical protein
VKKAKKGSKPDKSKKAGSNKAKPPKKAGAQVLIKKAVIADPKATTEKIAAVLAKKGVDVTPSAVSTIRSGTLQTMRLIKEAGGLPKGDW